MPKYLIIHIKRFYKNEYFIEKNPTIVNFPIRNLDLTEFVWNEETKKSESDINGDTPKEVYKYDLVANIIHDGKAEEGSYRV